MNDISKKGYGWTIFYICILALLGFSSSNPSEIVAGLEKIILSSDILITDYFVIAGIGPAFMNVALVTMITVVLLYYNDIPMDGKCILTIGLMSGFSFFGKNIFNMWFILLGTYLFCRVKKEKFSTYLTISLLSTALGPLISSTFFYDFISFKGVMTSFGCGIIIGFIMPMLALHTDRLLHGLNLYNGGFAIGLLALIIVPILKSYGFEFNPVNYWYTGDNLNFGCLLYAIFIILIFWGYLKDPENSFHNYLNILKRPGNSREDFIHLDGMPAVLINMGVNGIVSVTYILLIGGDLNGPTLGGILTILGFSTRGKHAKNIIPIFIGVTLGGLTKLWSINSPSAQLAALFGTTLAPVAGTYGAIAGIIAGFIHSSVVLHAGLGYSGVNLYNNGYAGGIASIVMYSVLSSFVRPNTFSAPSENIRLEQERLKENLTITENKGAH